MIVDCFPFLNELDILEIRLNCLAPYVERFVLVESPFTWSGNPKPLYFEKNKDRFRDFNIVHLVADDCEKYIGNPREMQAHQRRFLMNGLSDVDPECIVLLSDVDEFPDLENYEEGREGVFRQKMYYYYMNVFTGRNRWHGTIATKRKNLTDLRELRDNKKMIRCLSRFGGWHFSYTGSVEQIRYKIESFCHQELNTTAIKDKIAENREGLVDLYNRWNRKFSVEMPSGPAWLLHNKEKYEHLFYNGRLSEN
jgi:beta-1,4-mannosyl-glycoprotein beta-1,4-N-acetylglucosaminyltransferase